ncbi:MAG: anti-sigma factor antagonist [Frankiales bacterium]|nr:anti-sigma factor antagonist [Frankiales bacterium]
MTQVPVLVLKPQGRLDMEACEDLRYQLAAAFSAGVDSVGIDLAGITDIDQTGLGVLSGAARHLARRGGALVITRATPSVATCLRINGLEDLLAPAAPVLTVVPGTGTGTPRGRRSPATGGALKLSGT